MKKNTDEHVNTTSGTGEEEKKAAPEGPAKTADGKNPPETAPAEEAAGESAEKGGEKAAEKTDDPSVRIKELEKMNTDLQDQYLRKAADFDNYRKRMIREKQEAVDFANTGLLTDLVQVLDDFDRAIDAGMASEEQKDNAALADGVSMIRNQLGSLLETKYGLEYYPSKDTAFDPNIHEAIGTQPDPDVTEPTVAEEYLKGYKLKGRIIRAAKVMVKMPQDKAAE